MRSSSGARCAYSRTLHFVDKGTQRGLTYDAFKGLEDDINKKLKTKSLKFHVAFIPVARNDLARDELVDFSEPVLRDVNASALRHAISVLPRHRGPEEVRVER